MVGRLTLDQVVKVRVLAPQPQKEHERGARRRLFRAGICQEAKLGLTGPSFLSRRKPLFGVRLVAHEPAYVECRTATEWPSCCAESDVLCET
jgi:hypothetical protein